MDMDLTPPPHMLASLRGERVNHRLLACEAVDNSFDANATLVEIVFDGDVISFKDDGDGIRPENIVALFTPGRHVEHPTTALGRYGIGIKFQAINSGDVMTVDTVSEAGRIGGQVDWAKLFRSGTWTVKNAVSRLRPVAVGAATYTHIMIEKLRPAPKSTLPKMREELEQVFHPAIRDGKRIVLNRVELACQPDPGMADVIERTLTFSDGRTAVLRAGMLTESSKLRQVHVEYKHRVIKPECNLGCGDYGGLNSLFVRVSLAGPWRLAKYKDDLPDAAQQDELDEAVHEVILPLLEKCNSASMDMRINDLAIALNERLPAHLGVARPRHLGGGSGGRGAKKGKSGRVDPDKSDPADGPAKTESRGLAGRLLITFDGVAELHGFGMFQRGTGKNPHRVNLSKDHPLIRELSNHRDMTLAVETLHGFATAIYVEGVARRQEYMFEEHAFGMRMAEVFAHARDASVNGEKKAS